MESPSSVASIKDFTHSVEFFLIISSWYLWICLSSDIVGNILDNGSTQLNQIYDKGLIAFRQKDTEI